MKCTHILVDLAGAQDDAKNDMMMLTQKKGSKLIHLKIHHPKKMKIF